MNSESRTAESKSAHESRQGILKVRGVRTAQGKVPDELQASGQAIAEHTAEGRNDPNQTSKGRDPGPSDRVRGDDGDRRLDYRSQSPAMGRN